MSEQGKTAEPDQGGDIVKSITTLTEMIKGGKIPQDETGLNGFRIAMKSFSDLLGLGTVDLAKAARCTECGFVSKSDVEKCGSCGGAVEKKTETEKSATVATKVDPEPGTHILVQPDGAVVIKGMKQFSRDRLSAVKNALSQLMGVMKETDPSGFAEMMSGFTVGASTSSTESIEPAMKSQPAVPAELTAALDKLTASIGEVSKRLETVEKSQGVSKALPDGKGDQVTKNNTNMWKGLV